MLTQKTQVINLASDSEYTFTNDLPAVENLVTAYLIDMSMTSQIHDQRTRDKYRLKVQRGKISASLGDFAIKI